MKSLILLVFFYAYTIKFNLQIKLKIYVKEERPESSIMKIKNSYSKSIIDMLGKGFFRWLN